MLRTYELKIGGDRRTIRFDPSKCPTWDGPQSQVEALTGAYLGEEKPKALRNFQLLDLRVGYISARTDLGRVETRDVELCGEDEGRVVMRRAMRQLPAAAPEPVQQIDPGVRFAPLPNQYGVGQQVAGDLNEAALVRLRVEIAEAGVALRNTAHPEPNGLGLNDEPEE